MQKTRKGFTLVELVVVIAVIAILAGVLIGTFASVINKANESAEVQKIKQEEIEQKATDLLKKLENSNWLGWEDFEANLVAKLTEAYKKNSSASITSDDVKAAVNDAFTTYMAAHQTETTQLTEEQVKAIIENALGTLDFSGVTEAQVKAIINAATTAIPTSSQIKAIVEAANAKNLTANDVAKVVAAANATSVETIEAAITSATSTLATSEQAEEILNYLSTTDSTNVILAKALNINISQKGLTTASYPYAVVAALGGDGAVNDLPETVLLDLEDGTPAFFVVDSDKKVVYDGGKAALTGKTLSDTHKYWTFASDVSTVYSTYLTAVPATVAPNGVGLDVGNQTIASVNYTNTTGTAQDVVIRTNTAKTSLTVNAPADTVKHYGAAGSVDLIAVASASYHEFGTVPFVEVAKGRVVLESDSKVSQIHVSTQVTAVADNGTKTKTENVFDDVVVDVTNAKELPAFSRDKVGTIDTNGTKVVTVETSNDKEIIYLFQQGIYEQIKVAKVENNTAGTQVWVDTSSAAQDVKDVATDIANNIGGVKGTDYNLDAETRAVEVVSGHTATVTDTGKTEAEKEAKKTEMVEIAQAHELVGDFWISLAADSFAGGKGTETEPYLVSNAMQLSRIAKLIIIEENEGKYATAYYKLTNDIDLSTKAWTPIGTADRPFKGHFVGDDKNIIGLTNFEKNNIDLNLSMKAFSSGGYGASYGLFGYVEDATISNVTIKSALINSNTFAETGFIVGRVKNGIDISNCSVDSNSSLTAFKKLGGIIGQIDLSGKNDVVVNIKGCTFEGSIVASSERVSGILGCVCASSSLFNAVTIENCHSNGTLSGTTRVAAFIAHIYNMQTTQVIVKDCNSNNDLTALGYLANLQANNLSTSKMPQEIVTRINNLAKGANAIITVDNCNVNTNTKVSTNEQAWCEIDSNLSEWLSEGCLIFK